ncbi:transposase [Cysteiniphilum halobium]|uniref:transposase n=1 Tax=Cysteiniphilum halobium TaxID=2219059 RepID=UPI003F82C615
MITHRDEHNNTSILAILDSRRGEDVLAFSFGRWISKVEKSEVCCFDTFIKTLNKYRGYIVNYFKDRETSGFVEGLNNKIKVIKRRCYDFFKTEILFRRLTLDLSVYQMLGL